MTEIFFDLDGVLANFDKTIGEILGTDNIYKWEFVYGQKAFWNKINEARANAFLDFEPMPGAMILWGTVEHLKPKVLTALPKTGSEHVEAQKREWVRRHLGSDVEVITCFTSDKPNYATFGAILIDDRAVNAEAWENRGGSFILHRDALTTWAILKDWGVI